MSTKKESTRTPTNKDQQQKIKNQCEEIVVLAEKGKIDQASSRLLKLASEQKTRAGEIHIKRTALFLLQSCNDKWAINTPPPYKLCIAFEYILGVPPAKTEPKEFHRKARKKFMAKRKAVEFAGLRQTGEYTTAQLAKDAGVNEKTAAGWREDDEFKEAVSDMRTRKERYANARNKIKEKEKAEKACPVIKGERRRQLKIKIKNAIRDAT